MENAKNTQPLDDQAEPAAAENKADEAEIQSGAADAALSGDSASTAHEEIVPDEPSLEDQLAAAKAESAENYNNYLRAVADLDTYRRRVMREKDDLKRYAIAGLLEDFLPVYDNLGLGLQSAEQNADPKVLVQGIQMVLTQFKSLLEENGISEIAPAPGSEFNPNEAEAFQTKPSATIEEGKVLEVARKGFSLNGRLIRPASVVVSGGSPAAENPVI